MPKIYQTARMKRLQTSRQSIDVFRQLWEPLINNYKNSATHKRIVNDFLETPYSDILINTPIGVEIECENQINAAIPPVWWTTHSDGSLRNNGIEFVTIPGITLVQWAEAAENLKEYFRDNPTVEFTERTSVHVHVNARVLNETQLRSLLAIYVILEDGLFSYMDITRKKSIFAVPIRESAYINSNINMYDSAAAWNKYAAFNLSRFNTLGTVEFRHMEGNFDVWRITLWIMLLVRLVTYARITPISKIRHDILDIKSSSTYHMFIEEILGELASIIDWEFPFLDNACTDAKVILNSNWETLCVD